MFEFSLLSAALGANSCSICNSGDGSESSHSNFNPFCRKLKLQYKFPAKNEIFSGSNKQLCVGVSSVDTSVAFLRSVIVP